MSNGTTKPIRLSHHVRGYFSSRGFTDAEDCEAIRTSPWRATRGLRWETSKEFPYNNVWNGTFYPVKRVRPIFVEDTTEIVVVTVYTYFF